MKTNVDKKSEEEAVEEVTEEIKVDHTGEFSENEIEKAREEEKKEKAKKEKEKANSEEEKIKNEDEEEKALFKIEQGKPKKVKVFDIALILGVLVVFGILSYFLVDKVFFNEIESNVLYYKLTFDSNGGSSVSPIEVREGYVDLPTKIHKEGYRFAGWAVDDEVVNGKYYVKKNTSFEAQWKSNEVIPEPDEVVYYSVIFDFNGAGNTYAEQVLAGEKVNKPKDPSLEGHTFEGWYNGDSIYNFDTKVTSDVTLKAQWKKKDDKVVYYTVTFDLNGGGSNYTKKVASGAKVSKPSNPSKDGYVFKGWNYDGETFDFNNAIKKDITLVAQWEKEQEKNVTTYKVTFEKNNGESSIQKNVEAGDKVTKPSNPQKTGYNFVGWYFKNNTQYNFNNAVNSNIVLYAKWAPNLNVKDKFVFVTTPENLNSNSYLADTDYGKNLLYKTSFKGNAEIYYSHKVSGELSKDVLYAIRIFNNSSNNETITINKCGAVSGNDTSTMWEQYYDNSCAVAGKKYTLKPYMSLIIMHNKNSFIVRDVNDQSGVAQVSGTFEGVLNITTSNNVHMAALVFKNLQNSYEAVYNG